MLNIFMGTLVCIFSHAGGEQGTWDTCLARPPNGTLFSTLEEGVGVRKPGAGADAGAWGGDDGGQTGGKDSADKNPPLSPP